MKRCQEQILRETSSRKWKLLWGILLCIAFIIPIEHKYDKFFRHFSLQLIPSDLSLPSYYEKKIYFYPSDLLILFLLFNLPLRQIFLEKEERFLSLIFLCSVLSIFLSPVAHYPIPYLRLLEILTSFALYGILAHCLLPFSAKQLAQGLLWALFLAALFQSAVAIVQFLKQAPVGLRLLGEPSFDVTNSFTPRIAVPDGHRWLFDSLLGRKSEIPYIIRSFGTFANPNVLAGFLFFSLLATYYLLAEAKWRGVRLFLFFSIPFQFFALSLTYSRSALFAWGFATVLWWVGVLKKKMYFKGKLPLFLAILLALGLTTSLLHEQYAQRGCFHTTPLTQKADRERLFYCKVACDMIRRHPWFGIGFSHFSYRSPEFLPPDTHPSVYRKGVHNIYLMLGAETGLISLSAFLFFLYRILKTALLQEKTLLSITLLSIFLGFLWIGCCDFYPFLFHQGKLMFFLSAALLTAAGREKELTPLKERRRDREEATSPIPCSQNATTPSQVR